MIRPPLPEDEAARLTLLEDSGLLTTVSDLFLDALVKTIARSFRVPMAAVTLIGRDMQFLRAGFGFPTSTTSRECSFCAHMLCYPSPLVVADATLDERFVGNPIVENAPFIRFYAGTPLHLRGIPVGALCIMDFRPDRPFGSQDLRLLSGAGMAVEERLIQILSNERSLHEGAPSDEGTRLHSDFSSLSSTPVTRSRVMSKGDKFGGGK